MTQPNPFDLNDDYQYFLERAIVEGPHAPSCVLPEPEPFELCLSDGTPLCDDDGPPDPDGFVLSNN